MRKGAFSDRRHLAKLIIAGMPIAASSVLHAQVASPALNTQNTATSSTQEDDILKEIVVTATRHAERLQDVPIAVSALSGEDVRARRIDNFADLVNIAPGPTFIPVKGTSVTSVQIRGQYSNNDATGLENPIGVYIDEIYYGSLASFDSDFFDVQQVAILRGPQGTTFGRNAVGGAVQITSNVAELGRNAAQFSATGLTYGGGHNGIDSQGFANVALLERLAGRIAYSVKEVDGYQHNLVTGKDLSDDKVASVRGSLVFEPRDDLKLTAMASFTHRMGLADGPYIIGTGALAAHLAAASGGNFHDVQVDDDGSTQRRIFSGEFRADWQARLGTLSSITGYRTLHAAMVEDSDGSLLPLNYPSINTNRESQISEEIRLTSPTGQRFEYLAGVYAGYEDLDHAIQFNFDGRIPQSYLSVLAKGALASQLVDGGIKNTSVGPYFEGKYHLNEQFALTAGIRYAYEKKHGFTSHVGSSPFYGGAFYQVLPGPLDPTDTWKAWTPRFIAEYKPGRNTLFYASASKGFQGGGWVLTPTTAAAAQRPLKAETTWSYEVGTKSTWRDGLLATNVAAFRANTSNLQVRSLVAGVLTDSNAGQERVTGVELETALHPTGALTLGANYSYLDATYVAFQGCAAGGVDCSGNSVPFTPKHDLTLLVDYTAALGSRGSLTFHVDDKIADKYQLVATNTQQIAVPYTARKNVMNASLTYGAPGGAWDLRLWSNNLLNKTYIGNALAYNFYLVSPAEASAAGGIGKTDAERISVAPPRSVGVTLTYRFD